MTIGSKVGFPGENIPSVSNIDLRGSGSTTTDLVTITMSSGLSTGSYARGLVVERYPGSENYNEAGGDVLFEVNYDGVRQRARVETLDMSATAITLSASESGTTYFVAGTSAVIITLPTAAAGIWFEFFQVGTCASGFLVQGASANMIAGFNDVSLTSIEVGTSGVGVAGGLRVVGAANQWYGITLPAFTSAAPTTATATYYTLV